MPNKPPRVLVVDDEQDICANLKDILGDLGYEVDVAYDGPSALSLVERQAYDVALLDLKMPGMDGLELYRRIKALRAGTVAIVVSAYATSETAQAALQAGAWKILSKPVDLSRLLPLVDEALEQPLVMIVDDDRDLCESLWEVLREHGFRVCLAHTAEQASRQLGQQDLNVILLDMKLPEGDGNEVFRLVRKSNPEARTVLITGFRGETELQVENALSEGANAVCYKPFDMRNLLQTIDQLSRQPGT